MKKKIVVIPDERKSLLARMLETTRTASARRALLGKKEYAKRHRSAHQRTAGTRRAQSFIANKLDAIVTMAKQKRTMT